MHVQYLPDAIDPLHRMFVAARTCYSEQGPIAIWQQLQAGEISQAKIEGLVHGCFKRKHNSVLRHANFQFLIEGISRDCLLQITRHQAGVKQALQGELDFDAQSQRYVNYKQPPNWVIPDHVSEDQAEQLRLAADATYAAYRAMIDNGMHREDARGILPGVMPTNLTMTINLAALDHLYRTRALHETGTAQGEIAQLVTEMARQVVERHPLLAVYFPAP